MYLIDVIIEHPIQHLDSTFTYLFHKEICEGVRVRVIFNNKKLVGFVKKCTYTNMTQSELENKAGFKYRYIDEIIDQVPLLNEELSLLCEHMANITFSPYISCLKTMLPPALKPSSSSKMTQKKLKVVYFKQMVSDLSLKQLQYLSHLKEVNKEFLKDVSVSSSIINTLQKKDAIEIKEEIVYRDVDALLNVKKQEYNLTIEQKDVLNQLMNGNNDKPYLLFGVTGSGKTEVYLQATKKTISNNKQVLMLVPEISLTPKIVALFKQRFGNEVAILHSKLSDGQRYDEYLRIKNNEVKVVVGARSAIFAPLDHIGLIIMDEEHDASYKQTTTPCYHTKDIALFRCKYHNAKLLLGSASPSIESYARAKANKYYLLQLTKRATNMQLPKCEIIDMALEAKKGNLSPFSDAFVEGLNECISNKKQALILVNRRGYSSYLLCKECGDIPKCPHCDVSLTYHKNNQSLECHYCGYTIKFQNKCHSCDSEMISFKGIGTEQMTELLHQHFNNLEILRYDVDTTRNKAGHEKLLEQFESKKANVLLGTQMISKGLDFEDVTFVGVLDGDGALAIPDYRSAERTFQLILQVSGRAGRHQDESKVVIQTYNPKHYAILEGANQNYQAFFDEEIKIRKMSNYPPYCYLLSILISGSKETDVIEYANRFSNYLKNHFNDIEVLGPAPAIISKMNDLYRYRITIKYKQSQKLFKVIHELKKTAHQKIKVEVDVNPYSQM